MFGFIFIYWIWKAFSDLAIQFNKNKWKYFFIGLVSYYGMTFISGFIYAITLGFINGFDSLADGDYDDAGLNLIFALFGGLGCYGVYKFLESRGFKQRDLASKDGIESIGVIQEN
ncbi:MAG: hypothetical protein WAM46_12410 [Flavobacterium sp.]|jgi:hypothetical protein